MVIVMNHHPRHRMRKAQCDEEEDGGVVNVRISDIKLADSFGIDDKKMLHRNSGSPIMGISVRTLVFVSIQLFWRKIEGEGASDFEINLILLQAVMRRRSPKTR